MVRTDCFAYTSQEGRSSCVCLTQIKCENCPFYKTSEQLTEERERSIERLQTLANSGSVVSKYYK